MARVTVEDCILNVPNRFELVLLAAKRAREVTAGASITVARDNDKTPVIALREISEKTISLDLLRENVIKGMQRHVFVEDHESELDEELKNTLESQGTWEASKMIQMTSYEDDEIDEID